MIRFKIFYNGEQRGYVEAKSYKSALSAARASLGCHSSCIRLERAQ